MTAVTTREDTAATRVDTATIVAKIHQHEGRWWAQLAGFPACATDAGSIEELRENIVVLAEQVLYENIDGKLQLSADILENSADYRAALYTLSPPPWELPDGYVAVESKLPALT